MKQNYSLNDIELKKFEGIENLLEPQLEKSSTKVTKKTGKGINKRLSRVKKRLNKTVGNFRKNVPAEDISINRIDEIDPQQLENTLIPKFKKLGLLHILRKKMVHFRFKHTQNKVDSIHKKRTFYIPKSAFVKRNAIFKQFPNKFQLGAFLDKIVEKDEKNNKKMSEQEKRRKAAMKWKQDKIDMKKKLIERRNQYFKITYNDSIIPDEIFNTSDYLISKRKHFVQDIHHTVSEFFST